MSDTMDRQSKSGPTGGNCSIPRRRTSLLSNGIGEKNEVNSSKEIISLEEVNKVTEEKNKISRADSSKSSYEEKEKIEENNKAKLGDNGGVRSKRIMARMRSRSRSDSIPSDDSASGVKKSKTSTKSTPVDNRPKVKQIDEDVDVKIEAEEAVSSASVIKEEEQEEEKKIKEEKMDTSELPETSKEEETHTDMVSQIDEDEADFYGFDVIEDNYSRFSELWRKRYKQGLDLETKFQDNMSKSLVNGPSTKRSKTVAKSKVKTASEESSSQLFFKPFEQGWVREVVYKGSNETGEKRNPDVFYISADNKKCRSFKEVADHLKTGDGLTVDNFNFMKEPLGLNDPTKEIIRNGKTKVGLKEELESKRQQTSSKSKLKSPKLVSPNDLLSILTPAQLTPRIVIKNNANLRKTPNSSKNSTVLKGKKRKLAGMVGAADMEVIAATPLSPDLKNQEVCSIECRLAAGVIPTLQCVNCLCLYHPQCLGLSHHFQSSTYLCKSCKGDIPGLLPPPPPLTPLPSSKGDAAKSQSIVGAVTTWLPPTSSIHLGKVPIAPKPTLDSSPQSLVQIQGRKFILVPKQNIVKLDGGGETDSANQAPAGVLLVPYSTAPGVQVAKPAYIIQAPLPSSDQKRASVESSVDKTTAKATTNGSASIDQQKESTTATPQVPPPNHMMNTNAVYNLLLHAFQYLKVHELLRASCVNRMWRDIASHRSLWDTVKMKNSRVRDWEGFGRALKMNRTRVLDLKKMLLPDTPESNTDMWGKLVDALSKVTTIEKIDVGRCTPESLQMLTKACPHLKSIITLAIRGTSLDMSMFNSNNLQELKIKSFGGLEVQKLSALKHLTNLKHLALTSVKSLTDIEDVLSPTLETLELGECSNLSETFATTTLPKLERLQRLRLEKGQGPQCPTIQLLTTIAGLEKLTQLELINFDIKPGFDIELAKCIHLRTLLIIPTYVTQSATTNHVVMGGVTKLSGTLTYLIWGLTLELLRVTDLFVDQIEGPKSKTAAAASGSASSLTPVPSKKSTGDSIPILKPLSDESIEANKEGQTTSQVDILALPKLQKVLSHILPTTKIKILKVPFSATWRQTVD